MQHALVDVSQAQVSCPATQQVVLVVCLASCPTFGAAPNAWLAAACPTHAHAYPGALYSCWARLLPLLPQLQPLLCWLDPSLHVNASVA